jgi:hypothetical protein
MPYSRPLPPVPIDKNKQGGKNMDASKMTDFRKVEAISAVRSTKLGFNNKNIYTDTIEQRRAGVMISGLVTIPSLKCPVCPSSVNIADVTVTLSVIVGTTLTQTINWTETGTVTNRQVNTNQGGVVSALTAGSCTITYANYVHPAVYTVIVLLSNNLDSATGTVDQPYS